MILTKEFQARLMSLKRSGKKKQYEQAMMVLSELGAGMQVSKNYRDDSRIPNCIKYELPDGFRVVFQSIEGKAKDYLALFIGSHDEVDRFLDNHKGWIFDPDKQGLKELRWSTIDEERTNIVRSAELKHELERTLPEKPKRNVFYELTTDQLLKAGVPAINIEEINLLTDPDSIEVMQFLDKLPSRVQDILLAFLTGKPSVKEEIIALLDGKREYYPSISAGVTQALEKSSEEFVDLRELPEEKIAFESLPFEDWMLFLHPDQKDIVSRQFNGPARIRGVSGSGKTVVAIHRARYFAREIIRSGENKFVLFLTYNKSLIELVIGLLENFCTEIELSKIQIMTVDKWCRDYVTFRYGNLSTWSTDILLECWKRVVTKHSQSLFEIGLIPSRVPDYQDKTMLFLKEEIDFIYGKVLHAESEQYLTCDRKGRGLRLSREQRKSVLELYRDYAEELLKNKQIISREINRNAYDLLLKHEPTEKYYSTIIIDEVQDLSEIELRVMHLLSRQHSSELLLIGDGAQSIYTRGYSMKNIGINVVGRSFVLRKNYRNTREIMNAAIRLMETEHIGSYDDEPDISQARAITSVHTGDKPLLMIAPNPTDEYNAITREIKYLINKAGIMPHEICCVSRSRWEREGLKKFLDSNGIDAIDYQADGIGDINSIKISNLNSIKGHEFRCVFILGLFEGAIPLNIYSATEDIEKEAALFYVAITRAREMLYFSYPKFDNNGRTLIQSRFLKNMEAEIEVINI